MNPIKSLSIIGATCFGAMTLCQCSLTYEGPNPEICTWPNDCGAAISYTFDDNCPNQLSVIEPMLNEYNIKGTFFPVINWVKDNHEFITKIAADGHEIGSHTVSHPNLAELSDEEAEAELHNSRTAIEEIIGNNYKCVTIAYPYCQAPKNINLVSNDYIVARICNGRVDSVGVDMMNVSSHPLGSVFNATTADKLQAIFESTLNKRGWSNLLFHEIDNGNGYSPFPSEEIRKSLVYLNNNDKYWVNTMGNIARYVIERDNCKVEMNYKDDKYLIKVTLDGYDEEIYNVPVTIKYTRKDGTIGLVNIIPNSEPKELDI